MKGVFAAVSGDAELGQTKYGNFFGSSLLDRGDNIGQIIFPMDRGLVECGGGDFDQLHLGNAGGRGK